VSVSERLDPYPGAERSSWGPCSLPGMRVQLSTAILALSLAGCCKPRCCPATSDAPSSLELRTRLADAERELAKAVETIETQRALIEHLEATQRPTMEQPSSGPRAEVISVQGSRSVTISFGTAHGLKVGDELVVARGLRYIGSIRITAVERSTSTAALMSGQQVLPIVVGDQVLIR